MSRNASGGADFDDVTSDAFLDKGKPDFNHGVSKFIRVGNDGPANRRPNRTVIKFDFLSGLAVSGVTESIQILNAYLELRVFSSEGTDDDGLAIDIFQLNRDWTEGDKGHTPADAGEVTWLAAMADVEDWSVAGAAGVGADRAGTPLKSIGLPAVSGMATFKQPQESAQISVVPLNIDFRGVPLDTTSAARSVTISNIGNSDLTVSDISLADASGSYALGDLPSLPAVIPSAGSETFSVTFTPTGAGAADATITINSDDADDPAVSQ